MRPTGQLHIGHFVGVLENYLKLQDKYESLFFIADLHALTTIYEETSKINENRVEVMLDWLAVGLDPKKATLFVQSKVPEHAYLHLLLSMIVPLPWVERNTTVKEMIRDLDLKENVSYGLLGYPILMTSDIIIYNAKYVPVGKDQVHHLEIAREIVRRFNGLYGNLFVEPQALLTEFSSVPGVDGRRMSKSLNNDIKISDSEESTTKRIMSSLTDPAKIKLHDKGHPDICTVYKYHTIFNRDNAELIKHDCKDGELGCVACKKMLAQKLNDRLRDIRARRASLTKEKDSVNDIFEEGSKKAREIAKVTLDQALTMMKLK
jgi:tryptophanyl-tRNA synthetase